MEEACQGSVGKQQLEGWHLMLPLQQWGTTEEWSTLRWFDRLSEVLLLSCFSHVQLCATPETAAHQAPPSLGFSRQEHWRVLPFPSPVHESEK